MLFSYELLFYLWNCYVAKQYLIFKKFSTFYYGEKIKPKFIMSFE